MIDLIARYWRSSVRFTAVSLALAIPAPPHAAAEPDPLGWTTTDIGSPALAGSATFTADGWLVAGAGADIWGTRDEFVFVHRQLASDGSIIARVASLANTHQWAKAGVMLRQSLAAGSPYAFALVTPDRGVSFQYRGGSDGPSSNVNGPASLAGPAWLKIERRGSVMTASYSADGVAWKVIGSSVIAFPEIVYVGLAVTSHSSGQLTLADFRDINVNASAGGDTTLVDAETTLPDAGTTLPDEGTNASPFVTLTSPTAGAVFTAPASITLSATASDTDGVVASVAFYAGSTLIGTDFAAPYSVPWSNVPSGAYSFTAVARDDLEAVTVSSTVDLTVIDPQVPNRTIFVPSSDHDSVVERYSVEFFFAGDDPRQASPVAVVEIGKPPVVNGECQADVSMTIAALTPGSYIATVTAIGSGGASQSSPSPPFTR